MYAIYGFLVKRLIQALGRDWGEPEYDTPVGIDAEPDGVQDLTDKQVAALHALVGGEARYKAIGTWVYQHKDQETLDKINWVIGHGDFDQVAQVVMFMEAMYEESLPESPADLLSRNGVEVAQ